jgi:hypothetical protein
VALSGSVSATTRAELGALREQLAEREHSPRFAAIYPLFEDSFRGAEAEVRGRLRPSSCSL